MKKKQKPEPDQIVGNTAKTLTVYVPEVEDAIAEIQTRIDLIGRDYAEDQGLMRYRRALILAVEALRKQLPKGS